MDDRAASLKTPFTIGELARHVLLLLAVLVAMFPGVFFRGELTPPGTLLLEAPPWSAYADESAQLPKNPLVFDIFIAYHGWYVQCQDQLEQGEWPLWNPLELTGMPLLANFQSAFFYPPRLLHAVLPDDVATTVFILFKFFVCGLTAYVCGRGIGLQINAARFFSLAWMLSGYVTTWGYWSLGDTAAWFPLLFLGTEWILRQRYVKGLCAGLVGATLGLLTGHPETIFTMSFGLAIYFFLRLALDRSLAAHLARSLSAMAVLWSASLAACAIQIVPFLEYLTNSHTFSGRPEGEGFNVFIQPFGFIAFWVPRFFGFTADGNFWGRENSNFTSLLYPGVAVWFAVFALGAKGAFSVSQRNRVVALVAASALVLLMAFNAPFLRFILSLPVVGSTVGTWHAAFALFALPLLAAIGVEHWFGRPRQGRELGVMIPAIAIPIVVITVGMVIFRDELAQNGRYPYLTQQLLLFGAFIVAAASVFAIHVFKPSITRSVALLTAVLVIDLFVARRDLHETAPRKWHFFDTALTTELQELGRPTRVSAESMRMRPGLFQPYGVEQLWGYDGIYASRILRLFTECSGDAWTAVEPICAVSHYLFRASEAPVDDRFRAMGIFDGVSLLENTRALPRARLVGAVRVIDTEAALFEAMRDPGFDPSNLALTTDASVRPFSHEISGSTRITSYERNRVVVDVESNGEAALILADAFYPGWKADVNGEPAAIFPAYHAFRGVMAPPGASVVTFTYDPLSFRAGYWISTTVLSVAAVVSALYLARMRQRSRTSG